MCKIFFFLRAIYVWHKVPNITKGKIQISSESLVNNSVIIPQIKIGGIRPSYISIFPWGNLILLKDTIKCIFMYIILSTEVSVHINTMMTTFSSGNNNELDIVFVVFDLMYSYQSNKANISIYFSIFYIFRFNLIFNLIPFKLTVSLCLCLRSIKTKI